MKYPSIVDGNQKSGENSPVERKVVWSHYLQEIFLHPQVGWLAGFLNLWTVWEILPILILVDFVA